jgi:hypothetical protein
MRSQYIHGRSETATKACTVTLVTGLVASCLLGGCGGGDSSQFVMRGSFASSDGIDELSYGYAGSTTGLPSIPLDGDQFSVTLDKGSTYSFGLERGGLGVGRLVFCDGMENELAIPSSAGASFDFGQFGKFTPLVPGTAMVGDWAPQNRPAWLTCTLTSSTGSTGSQPTPSLQRCFCDCLCENCIASTEGQLANPGQTCADICPGLCGSAGSSLNCGFWQGTVLNGSCVPEPNP